MKMQEKTFIIADKKFHIIKTGRSTNPQDLNSNELEIICVFEDNIEKEIKVLLKDYKVRGEWYYPDPKTLLEIQEKYLPNKNLQLFIDKLFGGIKIRDQPTCLCWVDDDETRCQHMRKEYSLKTCESYEIWKACVRKEEDEIDFGD